MELRTPVGSSAVVAACAALLVCGASGCGRGRSTGAEADRSAPRARAESAARRQLLFAFPELGRVTADCSANARYALTYRAVDGPSQDVAVVVGGTRLKRRTLDPGAAVSFSVPATERSHGTTPTVVLTAFVTSEPLESRLRARFRLAAAAGGTLDCVARSAAVRVSSRFHSP